MSETLSDAELVAALKRIATTGLDFLGGDLFRIGQAADRLEELLREREQVRAELKALYFRRDKHGLTFSTYNGTRFPLDRHAPTLIAIFAEDA